MKNIDFHPLADIFPLIHGKEFVELKADIRANGVREPIWLLDSKILDGRNRFRAAQEVGVQPEFREYQGDDPLGFVVSLNLHRRHLTESQRAMVAAKIANMKTGDNQHTTQEGGQICPTSNSAAAEMLNVSERSVKTAKSIFRDGDESLQQAVTEGKTSLNAASDIAKLPKEEQREVVARGEKEILQRAKEIRSEKAKARKEENDKLKAENRKIPLPQGMYRTIVIDPPWDMKKIQRDVAPNQVDFDYPTMSLEEISGFDVGGMAHDDCWLFCWTTQKYLPDTFSIIEGWGFKYIVTMTWHKTGGFQPFGLPQYNSEFVLIGKKGSAEFDDTKQFFLCNSWPRREHSRKPDEFYDLVSRVSPAPRIDIFSREKREGFDQFGNETDKFAINQ